LYLHVCSDTEGIIEVAILGGCFFVPY